MVASLESNVRTQGPFERPVGSGLGCRVLSLNPAIWKSVWSRGEWPWCYGGLEVVRGLRQRKGPYYLRRNLWARWHFLGRVLIDIICIVLGPREPKS